MPRFISHLLNFFFPRTCYVCRGDVPVPDSYPICRSCRLAIPKWPGLICQTCGIPLPDGGAHCYFCLSHKRRFQACRSAGIYEGPLKTCLLLLKYNGKESLAKPLGDMMADEWVHWPELHEADTVMSVPLHFWQKHRRTYNQSDLLAKAFCGKTNLPWIKNILFRKKMTRSQTRLKREDRFENMEGAFGLRDHEAVRGKTVLLIDDVCTTGATLDACAHTLRTGGARKVYAMTVARQV